MNFVPDLAVEAPLWLALVTVGVNAVVGGLRASIDDRHHWDIVGLSTFALLMGLGGGFIRDFLIGNLPAESLRRPWFLVTIAGCVALVLVLGERISKNNPVVSFLNAVALGLFSVTGCAYALRSGLPVVSALFIGTVSAVGGGVLVSIMKDEVPSVLLASTPQALLALLASSVYSITSVWSARAAAVAGLAAAIASYYTSEYLGVRTQRAVGVRALLLTRRGDQGRSI